MKRFGPATCLAAVLFAALVATVRLAAQEPHPNALTTQIAKSFTTLYRFQGTDGANSYARVIMDAVHNLYGTTINGGAYGNGTVFKLDTSGNETVLYNFTGGSDGLWPYAGVKLDDAGNLYGTTHSGGTYGDGTVFELDTSGNETVLHSFAGGEDGSVPLAGVIGHNGKLYGTTYVGGVYNNGTVFRLDRSGNETVLYTFTGGSDGGGPYAGSLITDLTGNFYGTTSSGGTHNLGTVFKLDTSGNETVLHSFDGSDGWAPYSGLVMDKAGNLYGTTGLGGAGTYCSNGCGTVFEINTSRQETVLYSFTGTNGDGFIPLAGLVRDSQGNLYGTTCCGGANGGGIVFKLDTSGHETVLYSFTGNDLAYSNGNLLERAGSLYGTTFWGGSSGDGTVFELKH